MIAGFDRKYLGRYFSTTHLRVNLPTQRGEAGAPLLNFKGEVVGILVSSLENNSSCYALPIDAAEKIHSDFVRFGEPRHGWVGINVSEAPKAVEGSRAEMTQDHGRNAGGRFRRESRRYSTASRENKSARARGCPRCVVFITAGDTVPITVMRGKEKLTFDVQADFHPAAQHPSSIAAR